MPSLVGLEVSSTLLATALVLAAIVIYTTYTIFYNVYLHPLARFPGPLPARMTIYWKTYIECVANRSFCHELVYLHARYGDAVRVGPNELHFAQPTAYHDIYNNKNRWDKEARLYKSFNEDRSSFGFLTYAEAKPRRDVVARSFSQTAIQGVEGLIVDNIIALCHAMTMDIITTFCFGQPTHAVDVPEFKAPIILAMDASAPVFMRFKHSDLYKNMILKCPPNLSKIISPSTAGLVDLQVLLLEQINSLVDDPTNLKRLPHNNTIYHRLMDADNYRDKIVPSARSLYEEAQALMFAGSDTVGVTLMMGTHHMLQVPLTMKRLKAEVLTAWPSLAEEPTLRELEGLPYLDAVIKESLRLASGVVTGLVRIVPSTGAMIAGHAVPPGTIVSCGSTFVHYNTDLFPQPENFIPERWLDTPDLDNWLVAFSRGPRMCLGTILAWTELRLTFAHVFRKFDMELAEPMPKNLPFRDSFLPFFYGQHLRVNLQPVKV